MVADLDTSHTLSISKHSFDTAHDALVRLLREYGPMSYCELVEGFRREVTVDFAEPVEWITVVVKLHMEATGELESLTTTCPERVRLAC